jgi:hypothetical protein
MQHPRLCMQGAQAGFGGSQIHDGRGMHLACMLARARALYGRH